jgi:hypothetical protein
MLIIVETYRNFGEPSASPVRVRPLAGQFKQSYHVWCSQALRTAWPVDSLFRVSVTRVERRDGHPYLRIGLNEPWEPISHPKAKAFIRKHFGGVQ